MSFSLRFDARFHTNSSVDRHIFGQIRTAQRGRQDSHHYPFSDFDFGHSAVNIYADDLTDDPAVVASDQAQSSEQVNRTERDPRLSSACVGKRTFVAVTSSPRPSHRAIDPPRARLNASRTA